MIKVVRACYKFNIDLNKTCLRELFYYFVFDPAKSEKLKDDFFRFLSQFGSKRRTT